MTNSLGGGEGEDLGQPEEGEDEADDADDDADLGHVLRRDEARRTRDRIRRRTDRQDHRDRGAYRVVDGEMILYETIKR